MIRFLQTLWVLPVAIPIYVLYLWPFEALGFLRRAREVDGTIQYVVVCRRRWYDWFWRLAWGSEEHSGHLWLGHALPGAVVCLFLYSWDFRLTRHERVHVQQWYRLGPLFPFVYLYGLIRYGYHENPLEVEAREKSLTGPDR